MGSTVPPNKLRRVTSSNRYRDLSNPVAGPRITNDLENLRKEINLDRAILTLPAPTGLYLISQPGAIELHWNELPESYRKSIDGARIWRATSSEDDRKDFYANQDKEIIVPMIRSTVHVDPVGNTSEEFIYWVQWINLDGQPSEATGGVAGVALYDSGAPGPVENLIVSGGNGSFVGSWSDPLTNILTLDNFAQQYSTTSSFTTAGGNICITHLLGKIYSHSGNDPGKTYWFRYVAHNRSGDTATNSDPRLVALLPDGWGPWTDAPGNPVSSGWFTGPDTGVPASITVAASANGLTILFGAQAMNNAFTVEEGQIRIKYEPNPGATVCNLTTITPPDADIANIPGTQYGARLTWAAPKAGRYFFSWRLRNTAFGWSDWTSDPTLVNVTDNVQTTNETDIGPPQDWTVETRPGTDQNSVFIYTSRPKVNGVNLLWVGYQVKDTSQGAWRAIDENAGAAVTYYDGSAINHKLNDAGTRLVRESGVGFGTAKVDDMLLIDVRGGQFHRNYCQWGLIQGFETGDPATSSYIILAGGFRPQVNSGLRIKVVKPPWTWDTEGYLGALVGSGGAGEFIAGKSDQQFVSAPIPIDGNFNSIDSRVWFENHYSRSDASSPGGIPTVSNDQVKVIKLKDDVIPGPVLSLSVTGANGQFVAKWIDPTTGYATIDDTAIQYATDPGFSVGGGTSKNWGYVNTLSGRDPGKTYYWRVAVHNQSDKDSHASTAAQLGAKGWGPWTAFGAPTAVSSGGDGSVPTDTVIPGAVGGLDVKGRNGEFIATWVDPTTGNQTLDDAALQYCTDAAFTNNGPGSPAKGWGKVNTRQGTDPDKTYYWRVAVHNKSGQASDSSTGTPGSAFLGSTGWGPWTHFSGNPVYSGLIPLDPVQYSDNLVFNGGYEMVTGGIPDGWSIHEGGVPGTWGSHTIHKEGNLGVVLVTTTTQYFAILSKPFPVRPGERLVGMVWAQSSGSGAQGFYFRLIYHSTTPDFAEPGQPSLEAVGDFIPGASVIPYNENFTKWEGQLTVPAGMYWARVGLWNWSGASGIAANYHFDDCQVVRIISGNEIDDNTIPPDRFKGTARTEFTETFEEPIGAFWDAIQYASAGAAWSRIAGVGGDGGYVLRATGACGLKSDSLFIPYDPRKLYRMTCRVRAKSWTGPTTSIMYLGVRCWNANKVYLGDAFPVKNAFQGFGQPGWTPDAWNDLTGFFKGTGGAASSGPANEATAPLALIAGTSYISPGVYLNWHGSATTGDVMEIDDIRIDILEETQYTSPAPNGTFSNQGMQVHFPYGDPISAAVNLYFSYTQGLVKADQIAVQITDGSAYWVQRVSLPPNNNGPFIVDLYRLNRDRTYNVGIWAEAFGAAGIAYSGTVQSPTYNYPPFQPGAPSGSAPSPNTYLGLIDWAGGNVWYESLQYRNNYVPTTGISGSVWCEFVHSGSGASRAVLHGLNSYNQGSPNIATHLAVLIKSPSGTINLYQDMVVTHISMGSLPADYQVPISIPDTMSCTVTVAAIAETKNGRQFNTTVMGTSTGTRGSGPIWLETSNYQSYIRLGHPNLASEYITVEREMRILNTSSSSVGLEFWHDGAEVGKIISGGGYIIWQNAAGKSFFVGPAGSWGFGVGTDSQANGVVYIGNLVTGAAAYPTNGGGLYTQAGTLKWITQGGNIRDIAYAGPHCAECGYDYWLIGQVTAKWGAALYICGWCGAVYKKGPKKVLGLLDEKEQSEIITKRNFHLQALSFFGDAKKHWKQEQLKLRSKNDSDQKPGPSRLRGGNARRRRKPVQNKMRRARGLPLGNR